MREPRQTCGVVEADGCHYHVTNAEQPRSAGLSQSTFHEA